MTHREKIEILRSTIEFLYEKEGRSKSYISKLLEVDRRQLTNVLNKEWKLQQGNVSYLTPSNQKFLNKHKNLIKSRLDNDVLLVDIANELGVSRQYISRTIIPRDDVLTKALEDYHARVKSQATKKKQYRKDQSYWQYDFNNLKGEVWKEILGYEGYFISNHGRVKRYVKTYDCYALISAHSNVRNGRMYVWIKEKALQVPRLVGFAFVNGHSEEYNTINHIDRDVKNNYYKNLEWMSQSDNNQHAYDTGRSVAISYQKNGKFKKIILDERYEFKTIIALARFLGKSETQTRRYIDNEAETQHTFKFVY